MILIIDNYDSFTYNIYQYLIRLGNDVQVRRNDQCTLKDIKEMSPSSIVLSPGPGRPEDAGICLQVLDKFKEVIPILGVCLGHQCIGHYFGAKIINAKNICHGKIDVMLNNGQGVFSGLPDEIRATRYHSLVIDQRTLPDELEITARTSDGEIMGIRHKQLDIEGVQFHPESIGSEHGMELLKNFVTPSPTLPLKEKGVVPKIHGAVRKGKVYESLHPSAIKMRKKGTLAEDKLWEELRGKKLGVKFRRQHIIDSFIVDFYCVEKALVVEVDGEIHLSQVEKDSERDSVLVGLGCRVIRFSNEQVLQDVDRVLDIIKENL